MYPWAAIFDWDGVVVDSMRPHEASWLSLAEEQGFTLKDGDFQHSFGMKNEKIILELFAWTSSPAEARTLGDRKELLFREIIAREGVTVLPGARELLLALRDIGIPAVIGSSTPRLNLDCTIAAANLAGLFAGAICAEDVTCGKPDPEVFLKAAALVDVPPARCLVLEDAPPGIAAGRAAGMPVLAVTTTRPYALLTGASRIVNTLADLTPHDLKTLINAHPTSV